MAIIRSFYGFRPRKDMVAKVASHPYDVVNTVEARELVKGRPHSFLHVVRSEVDLPVDVHPYDDKVYAKAKENLENMISSGIMVKDDKPSLYLYQQQMGDHKQTGIVACASIEDYENDVIKKHELTRAEKENDRAKHVEVLNANTGPVFLTYPAVTGIDKLVSELIKAEPEFDFQVEDDGTFHRLWPITNPDHIDFLIEEFAKMPTLYVADGHHRSASAFRVGKKRREANPNHTGNEEYNFFLSVIFPGNQLKIMDYNRVVLDLNGLSQEEFIKQISEKFTVEKQPVNTIFRPQEKHTFGMYLPDGWYKLVAKSGTFDANDFVKALDVSNLQDNLLSPILAIGDPRKDNRIDFVGGIRGLEELEKRVKQGDAVAFALYPTSVDDLMHIADTGTIMPPKSTWFEPKLKSGLVIHFLD
jgi:uncharacterized protein (DUF1015 family)